MYAAGNKASDEVVKAILDKTSNIDAVDKVTGCLRLWGGERGEWGSWILDPSGRAGGWGRAWDPTLSGGGAALRHIYILPFQGNSTYAFRIS